MCADRSLKGAYPLRGSFALSEEARRLRTLDRRTRLAAANEVPDSCNTCIQVPLSQTYRHSLVSSEGSRKRDEPARRELTGEQYTRGDWSTDRVRAWRKLSMAAGLSGYVSADLILRNLPECGSAHSIVPLRRDSFKIWIKKPQLVRLVPDQRMALALFLQRQHTLFGR